MYDIPERTEIRKCIITEETIRDRRTPLLLTKTEVDKGVDETNYEVARPARQRVGPRAPNGGGPIWITMTTSR